MNFRVIEAVPAVHEVRKNLWHVCGVTDEAKTGDRAPHVRCLQNGVQHHWQRCLGHPLLLSFQLGRLNCSIFRHSRQYGTSGGFLHDHGRRSVDQRQPSARTSHEFRFHIETFFLVGRHQSTGIRLDVKPRTRLRTMVTCK